MSYVDDALFIRALKRLPVPRTPIWFMRQAGRYLPEYRSLRAQAKDFMTFCKTPDLACEATLQPLRRFSLDAAILFSDILTIPDALGLGLSFKEGEGPHFAHPLRDLKAIDNLDFALIEDKLFYVMDAVKLIRQNLAQEIPLIGFAGSPWTLACYMIEGQSSPHFSQIKTFMEKEPAALHRLLAFLAKAVAYYLLEQIKAGVNALMIFDTWGGLLPKEGYLTYSLAYMRNIVCTIKAMHPDVPIILFTKAASHSLSEMAATGCDALSLDWTCTLKEARALVGHQVALQGNLNPAVLLKDKEQIKKEVQAVLESYGMGAGHIFNLGHGITPDVLPEHVACMVETVNRYSPDFHHFL